MKTQAERLVAARKAANYDTATQAALAMNVRPPTYLGHENGTTPITRAAERYARFFRVSLEWLLTGRGEMRSTRTLPQIPIHGMVGAGAAVEPIEDAAGDSVPDSITWPDPETLAALIVHGDSQLPVYYPGQVILYDARPLTPQNLVNRMAIVQCEDGRRLVKRIRRGTEAGKWSLESLNAKLEENVPLLGAYEIIGTLDRR